MNFPSEGFNYQEGQFYNVKHLSYSPFIVILTKV
ncbi:hypothetical protein J2Y45_006184 [Dyadobacter sp. BE34]|uniref:Uncharacterized protein n=1 Tax=Dyadobacter fermentans TaxID=94254 RepID=A0ABU1R7Q4_9BACT|nr:hypothetical protein [Dyadobacter fermentans]MDR7046713.1 hypothetical protein [Dyadobacter sp. BE242]MDR7201027.1 hypothetical protein [Dyadobacter sp. BE34]MDR7218987.1 hypothetical protein [Dyadobacter sp. BE31]MDR7264803.1 hypothetical protein [Dyadobacter sp. BE32]